MRGVEIESCALQVDFGYFGPPEEHAQWTQEERDATYISPEEPSSEICGEVAAAFAASSLALKDTGALRLLGNKIHLLFFKLIAQALPNARGAVIRDLRGGGHRLCRTIPCSEGLGQV